MPAVTERQGHRDRLGISLRGEAVGLPTMSRNNSSGLDVLEQEPKQHR